MYIQIQFPSSAYSFNMFLYLIYTNLDRTGRNEIKIILTTNKKGKYLILFMAP
jgi:hypothetical protein